MIDTVRVLKTIVVFPLLAVALAVGLVAEFAREAALIVMRSCADWINE